MVRELIAAVSLAWMPGTARAELIPVDLFTPGDALLTRDTVSQLEWLDVSATAGATASSYFTYGQIESGAGGWRALGFRHALLAELADLALQSGFPEPVVTGGYGFGDELFQPVRAFLALLGCSEYCRTTNESANGFFDDGLAGVDGRHGWAAIDLAIYDNPHFPPNLFRGQLYFSAQYDVPGSHFLVRAVPEPDALLLLSLLSIAVATVRRAPRARVG